MMRAFAAASRTRGGSLLWSASAAIVLAAHIAAVVALTREAPSLDAAEDAGAFAVELSADPVAARDAPSDAAPGPLRTAVAASAASQSETKPDEPKHEDKPPAPEQPTPTSTPPPPTPPAPEPEAVLPKEAAPPPAQSASAAAAAPVEATSAPQVAAPSVAAVAKTQSIGAPIEQQRHAAAAWQNRLLDVIERKKRYPAQALAQRSQGTATVAFRIDRDGHLLEAEVSRSSGSPALDAEAIALMRRADPFPAPPASLPDAGLSLSVPIRFVVR